MLSIYDPYITIQFQSPEASCGNSQNVSKYIWKFKRPRRIKTILKNKDEFLMIPSGKITQSVVVKKKSRNRPTYKWTTPLANTANGPKQSVPSIPTTSGDTQIGRK